MYRDMYNVSLRKISSSVVKELYGEFIGKGTLLFLSSRGLGGVNQSVILRNESLNLKEEESHLMKTFIGNAYPRAFVRSASKQRTPKEPDDNKPRSL